MVTLERRIRGASKPRTQLHDLVSNMAAERTTAVALTTKSQTFTYDQLWQEISRLAVGLGSLGLSPSDRVAIYLETRVETVVAAFGASAAGLVFVPINPLFRSHQVAHILSDCGARVLVTSPERLRSLQQELSACQSLEHIVVVGGAEVEPLPGGSPALSQWEVFGSNPGEVTTPARTPIDVDMAAILYTSGSTGKPKGVVLSHRNLLVGAESVNQYLATTSDDVILAALPLSFDAGFSQLTTGFLAGAEVVLINYLIAADVVSLCAEHSVTGLTGVPPLWMQLADQAWPEEASQSLRYFANTGGAMPRATLDRLRAIFPHAAPYLMYGLTEAFRSTYLDPAEVDRRPDSIGKAIPNAEVLVVRPDGSPCDPGEEGELVHRGALVSMGYWNDPERTAVRFRPAPGRPAELPTPELAVWSGDVVRRDEEGFLYFVGRRDEMIKTSGYRVSPTEIEDEAYGTGLIGAAVAFGEPDPRLGQHIVLVVSPPRGRTVDADELSRELRKRLPMYMVPQQIHVRASIPTSPNGKLDREKVRRELAR
jgi:acyl-CoA ligase (AMP-forming) (exosortase A-associated)